MNFIFVFLFALPFGLLANPACYFSPPDHWECIHSKNLPSQIQIAFIGKGQSGFRPSLNLAIEEIDCSLKEYLKSVRKIHEEELNVRWRDLGPFTFHCGPGRLTEITSASPFGEVKMLQAIFVQDGCAYILTGAVLREEFSRFQNDLIAAMRSFTVAPDLFSAITDDAKKSALQQLFRLLGQIPPDQRNSEWERLQKVVLEDHASLGPCWHFFVLKEGYSRIFPTAEAAQNLISDGKAGQKPPSK